MTYWPVITVGKFLALKSAANFHWHQRHSVFLFVPGVFLVRVLGVYWGIRYSMCFARLSKPRKCAQHENENTENFPVLSHSSTFFFFNLTLPQKFRFLIFFFFNLGILFLLNLFFLFYIFWYFKSKNPQVKIYRIIYYVSKQLKGRILGNH